MNGQTTAAAPPDTYTVGSYTFADVQVRPDSIDDFEVLARVTNNGPTVSASWTVTIFAGGSVVATASGSKSDFQQGSTVTVTFITSDDYRDWDAIEFQIDYEF